jgi:hypothetical protein
MKYPGIASKEELVGFEPQKSQNEGQQRSIYPDRRFAHPDFSRKNPAKPLKYRLVVKRYHL